MIRLLRPLATRQNSILLLLLSTLVCLPFSLQKVVQDAALSLLLPVTILGASLAFAMALTSIKNNWVIFFFILCGPLILFFYISHMENVLLAFLRESLIIATTFIPSIRAHPNFSSDLTTWLSAASLILKQAGSFGQRLFIWMESIRKNDTLGDPAARAFVWSLGLWLTATWAGWQLGRHGKTLLGLTPATFMLGIILNNTSPKSGIIWLYLCALMLLLGVTNYENLVTPWKRKGIDYSNSIWEETLITTLVLVLELMPAAYMVSTFSFKEMMDRVRENQAVYTNTYTSPTEAVGIKPQIQNSLPAGHTIMGGPKLSMDVVMLIKTGEFPPLPHQDDPIVPHYRWRTMTYESYTGSGWINPNVVTMDVQPDLILIKTIPSNYRVIHQTLSFPPGVAPSIHWTGALVRSDAPLQVVWHFQPFNDLAASGFDPLYGADLVGGVISSNDLDTPQSLSVDSLLPEVSATDLHASLSKYPGWVSERYQTLPDTIPERVRALARDITAREENPYDRALAIESYLRAIPYDLNVPAPPVNRDAVDYFLFDLKRGYCDYYATAMTVLARAAGLPARLVIGFASGTYDPDNAQYVIRQADAHAWTEIYFSGIGWIEFEPTASQPAIIRNENGLLLPQPAQFSKSPEAWYQILTHNTVTFNLAWMSLVILIVLYLLWISSEGLRLSRYSPSEAIQRLYQRLRNLTRPIRGKSPTDETAFEYSTILADQINSLQKKNSLNKWMLSPVRDQVKSLTDLYQKSLFSPAQPTHADIHRAVRTWSQLRWRLFLMMILLVFKVQPASEGGVPSKAPDHSSE